MLVALILSAASPQAAVLKPACKAPPTLISQNQRGRARPLNSDPPARQYYTVLRTEDGCQKPVLVSEERLGRPPRR